MKKIQGTVVLKADEKKKNQIWNKHLATFMEIKCAFFWSLPGNRRQVTAEVEPWAAGYSHWR